MPEFRKTQLIAEDGGGTKQAVRTSPNGAVQIAGSVTQILGDIDQINEVQSGTINDVDQIHSGSIEVTGGTVNTQVNNLNYAGTVAEVNQIHSGSVEQTNFTETRTISTDNVGLAKGYYSHFWYCKCC